MSQIACVVIETIKVIHQQAQDVKFNQEQCLELIELLRIIEPSLEEIKETHAPSESTLKALEVLKTCVNACAEFIAIFSGEDKRKLYRALKRFVLANNYKSKFMNFRKQLLECSQLLGIKVQAEQLTHLVQAVDERQAITALIKQQFEANLQAHDNQTHREAGLLDEQRVIQHHLMSMQSFVEKALKPAQSSEGIPPELNIPFYETGRLERIIGQGTLATVYLSRWCEQPVAIKLINHPLTEQEITQFSHEVVITSQLRNRHIIQCYGACLEPERACLVLEYLPGGSLYERLGKTPLSLLQQQQIALSIARGLYYAHQQGIYHCDLKSHDVLFDAHHESKLADFGFAKVRNVSSTLHTLEIDHTAIRWQAPEIFKKGYKHNEKADIYSYGIILWEIVTGKRPFADCSDEELIEAISNGRVAEYHPIPNSVPEALTALIRGCWQAPNERPDLVHIICTLEAYQPAVLKLATPLWKSRTSRTEEKRSLSPADETYQRAQQHEQAKEMNLAFNNYLRAAEWGHARAQLSVALCYLQSKGVACDKKEAYRWLEKSAYQGYARAQYNMGKMLMKGDGVDQDLERACEWFKLSAKQTWENQSKAEQRYKEVIAQLGVKNGGDKKLLRLCSG